MQVANTILSQLGGNRFVVMTGAKNLVGREDGLSFKIGQNAFGVTHVRVTLTAMDDYTVEFLKIRGTKITPVACAANVYADTLRAVFESKTGLRTSL